MQEQAEYVAGDPAPAAEFIRHHACPHCKRIFGSEYRTDIDGRVLRVGILEIKHLSGRCVCRNRLYWSADDQAYKDLMRSRRRAERRAQEMVEEALQEVIELGKQEAR